MQKKSSINRVFLATALGPQLLLLFLIFLGPFLYMVWLSFTNLSFAQASQKGAFVGLQNYYRALVNDPMFWTSMKTSAIYMLFCVLPQITFGLIFAEWLATRERLRNVISPLLSLPVLLPAVVVGLLWRLLLQGEFGVLSFYLQKVGLFAERAILSDVKSILITLSLVDFWQWAPFVVLVLLAARLSLPKAPLEAAQMDGARYLQIFRDITIPYMLPTVGVVLLIRAIDSFKEFDKVFILTGGGPGNASEMSSIYIWRVAFKQWDYGYGAALCTIVYLVVFAGIRLFVWLAQKKVPA